MIDDIEKSLTLVERMQAALPICASTTAGLRRTLQQSSKQVFPHECRVVAVRYLGDEGGIACILEFGSEDTTNVHVVSITHLRFDHRHPLAREIGAYCKHRIKRLKKLDRGLLAT